MPKDPKERPRYLLLPGNQITAETIAELYRQLTGREPTPEEMDRARATLAQRKPVPLDEGEAPAS